MSLRDLKLINLDWTESPNDELDFQVRALVWENGRRQIKLLSPPFKPYFYLRKQDCVGREDKIAEFLTSWDPGVELSDDDAVSYRGEPLIKVSCSKPSLVKVIRENIPVETYLADVPYWRRVMIDLNLQPASIDKELWFDIEVDPRYGAVTEREKATGRILSIAAVDSEGREEFFCSDDELEILLEFLKFSQDYQILSGWNVERFDVPYIIRRANKLGLPLEEFHLPYVDGLQMYKQMNPKGVESYSLKSVAKLELGKEKVDYETPGRMLKLVEYFENDREKLKEYNVEDCRLCRDVDLKLGMTSLRVEQCKLTHFLPPRVKGRMSMVDSKILSVAYSRSPKLVYPSKRKSSSDVDDYVGPVFLEPTPGLHRNVIVIDYKAIHPSTIQTFNIGPETFVESKDGELLAVHGSFRATPESVIAEAIRELTEKRYEYKRLMDRCVPETDEWNTYWKKQKACKTLALSCYGVIGSPKSRYYNRLIAENITLLCREFQRVGLSVAKQLGLQPIYGAVDSLFLKLQVSVDPIRVGEEFCSLLNEKLVDYCNTVFRIPRGRVKISVDLDRIYGKLLLTNVKQKYCGYVIYEEGKHVNYFHAMGFEFKKGDTIKFCRKLQSELLRMKLDEKPESEIVGFLKAVKVGLFAGKFDDMLVMYKGLSKKPEEYVSNKPQHVKAAESLMSRGVDIRPGDKIPFIPAGKGEVIPYIDGEGKRLPQRVYVYVWNHYVEPMLERIGVKSYSQKTLEGY